jgi:hypothetical protein
MYDIGVMGCTCRNVNIYLNYSGDDDVMAEEDKDSQHVNDMLTDTATTSKELIQNLALNIPSATQLISVRRKFLWDDYVICRKKSWFKTYAWLRVHFVGEEAVDGGGPRREFFTGKYGNSEYGS